MSKSRNPKLREGDVFAIPLSDDRVTVGQSVCHDGAGIHFLAAFGGSFESMTDIDIDAAIAESIVFLALSADALVYHGRWPVIGTRPVQDDLPFPAYKVGTLDGVLLMDYRGERSRNATSAEAAEFPYSVTVAPIRLQRALQALHGLAEWDPSYEELRPRLRPSERQQRSLAGRPRPGGVTGTPNVAHECGEVRREALRGNTAKSGKEEVQRRGTRSDMLDPLSNEATGLSTMSRGPEGGQDDSG